MKMITVAGAHACGKTSVILKTAELLLKENCRPGVMKLDCISSEDDRIYSAAGITNVKYISGNICPDHYFADSISDIFQWGLKEKLDLLITESAGLCGRCSPHIRDIPAVCVIDCLSGITAPQKIGPMLRYADFIAVTKGDLVSPAEREVFSSQHPPGQPESPGELYQQSDRSRSLPAGFLHPGKCGGGDHRR